MVEIEASESDETFDIDEPVRGIFFSVFVKYNLEHPSVRRKVKKNSAFIESNPLPTFRSANECLAEMAKQIRRSYRGSEIFQINPEEVPDLFTLFIIDKKKRPIAKVGVVAEDYRESTIH